LSKKLHVIQRLLQLIFALLAMSHTPAYSQSLLAISPSNGSGPYFYADDGNCGGSREIPRAAYLVVKAQNTSSTDTLFNVLVKLTGNSNYSTGFKPLSHTDDSTFVIPRILPISTEGAYFFIQYPCTKALSSTFDFRLTDSKGDTTSFSTTITTKDMQPASAGGDILSHSVGGTDALGVCVMDTVTYEFGNFNGGEMYFQPCGDTAFPTSKLELTGSKILSSPFSSCGPSAGDVNQLYYFNSGRGCGAGSGNEVKVVFYYISTLFNETTYIKPYAGMLSGSTTKYSTNFGSGVAKDSFVTTNGANKFTIEKTASCGICTAGDIITYTITVVNTSSSDLMFDQILDSLPAGHTFVGFASGSDITAANASIYPTAGDTGNITFKGLVPESTFPDRSFLVPASDSISLKYRVQIPNSSSNDLYSSSSIGQVGSVILDTSVVLTCAGCTALPVTMIYFEGEVVGQTNVLTWVTGSELNNSGFDLYRITDGYETWLGHTEGAGNSLSIQTYTYTDLTPEVGSTLYRLDQNDFDGHTTSFYTRVKRLDNEFSNLSIYPNPATDAIMVSGGLDWENAELSIFTVTGERVLSQTLNETQTQLSLVPLQNGTYFVEITRFNGVKRFMKVVKI